MNNQLKVAIVLLSILVCFCLLSFFPDILQSEDEIKTFYTEEDGTILIPPYPPSSTNWLGTNQNGEDILTLLITAGRDTLLVVLAISLIRFVIAVPLGMLSYQNKGICHWIIHGLNTFFSMVPILIFTILVLNLPFLVVSEQRLLWALVLIALLECGRVGVSVQNHVRQVYQSSYMEGAIVNGSRPSTIFKYYYWRHLKPQLIVMFFLDTSKVMLLLGQLGFLSIFLSQMWLDEEGVGIVVRNTLQLWPSMLADTRQYLRSDIWIPLFPALLIAYTIFSLQLFGEGLRKQLEQRK
ncbi:ABC transporter permease [Bacillus suaedae]|uniref:ABC transporter permease subunit n=1 Tax=Halalkalibacter suaedae TaxID=2822140 RepID=A0A940WVJ2_9BACI|nr:ABC transporter permease subunit [Bacillus suaedae]MBP3953195.1 ABC transporter permease subunit [Bacillus suaedae]